MLRRVLSWGAAFATRSMLSLTAAPRHYLLHSKGITGVIKVAGPGFQCLPAVSASPMMCDTHACSGHLATRLSLQQSTSMPRCLSPSESPH